MLVFTHMEHVFYGYMHSMPEPKKFPTALANYTRVGFS